MVAAHKRPSAAEAGKWVSTTDLGYLTSSVQIGFILGTLILATSGLADRFPASRIFAISSLLGALFNGIFALTCSGLDQAIIARFSVGLCLAGIYPLGMKMVIAWTKGNAGSTLGLLVAMLTLGTALPHGVRAIGADLSWQGVVLTSSALAVLGGVVVFILGDGPYLIRPQHRPKIRWGAALMVFGQRNFRSCAMGYFGHMWELYAFWTVVPFLVGDLFRRVQSPTAIQSTTISGLSFAIIGIGAVGCIAAGLLSKRFGSPRVAAGALAGSGLICATYPFFAQAGIVIAVAALAIWGIAVIADSAQFAGATAVGLLHETSLKHRTAGASGASRVVFKFIGALNCIVMIQKQTQSHENFLRRR